MAKNYFEEEAMKTMNCKELGGACDLEFHADTFDEVAQMSRDHGMEMFQKKDEAHLEAMYKMQTMMNDSEAIKNWIADKKKQFEELPSD
jgi:predicted small metal-binding protein